MICPYYIREQGREIVCAGITDDSRITLRFRGRRAKERQMRIYCCSWSCEKCELYRAVAERFGE